MSDYKDLNIWKESMDLVESVYKIIENWEWIIENERKHIVK